VSKQEQLQHVLDELQEEVSDVQGAMLASRDGLPIVSTMDPVDASRVAAMAATVLALGARVVETTGLGTFDEAVIQSDNGTFVVYDAGDLAALAVMAQARANLGLVHIEARRAAEVLAHLMASFRDEASNDDEGSVKPFQASA
jgi:uncharacterized protein